MASGKEGNCGNRILTQRPQRLEKHEVAEKSEPEPESETGKRGSTLAEFARIGHPGMGSRGIAIRSWREAGIEVGIAPERRGRRLL